MKPLAGSPVFVDLMGKVSSIPVLGVVLGAVMTLVVQSSSATIAVLQNFASQAGPDGVSSVIGLTGAIPILLGVLLPAVLREYGSCIAPKLAVLADALSLGGDTVSEKAERMIAAIEAMRDSFDIPSTLPHLSPNDYTEIARRALKEANPTYPVPQIWDSEKIFSVLRRVQS